MSDKYLLPDDVVLPSYEGPDLRAPEVVELAEKGYSSREIASIMQADPAEIKRQTKYYADRSSTLGEYRNVQGMQMLDIQRRILGSITDDEICEASLKDKIAVFKTLKDKELVMDGKPTEITGIVGYLVQLEKEETGEVDITPEPELEEEMPVL